LNQEQRHLQIKIPGKIHPPGQNFVKSRWKRLSCVKPLKVAVYDGKLNQFFGDF
jgi:hypothetical protein